MNRKIVKKVAAVFTAASLVISGLFVPEAAQAAAQVKLNKKKVTLVVGKTVKLKLKHAKKVKWSSSNKKVATVSKTGKVKGKKKGKANIIAKSGGKKYVCKVTVKKAGSSSPQEPGASSTQKPAETAKPSASPGAVPNFSGSATTTSSNVLPASAAEDTLAVGNLNVTLGMSKTELETKIGAKPDRTEASPLGFDSYIYNPSLDYSNYTQIQFDNDKVVCICTMSNYFRYENLVAAGEDTEDTLKSKGFKSMKSSYDYEAGYMYETDTEYVTAFVDHQGSKRVYAVGVYSKKTSQSDATKLDNLVKAEYGKYDTTVHTNMAKELFDWACVFRVVKGLKPFAAYDSNAAQLHCEDMAANGFVGENSSNGTTRENRFESAYPGYIGSAECNAARSLDAFGFITWLADDTESGAYALITKSKDKNNVDISSYYLCTGFASNSQTTGVAYATLDMFYY